MNQIKRFFEYAFQIRSNEFVLVQCFLLYYMCIGGYYTLSVTVTDALFLAKVEHKETREFLFAAALVGLAITTPIATSIYNFLQGKIPRFSLLITTQILLFCSIVVFWRLVPGPNAGEESKWYYFCLILWVDVCAIFSSSLFYSFAGDYFTSRDAKRLYGYIGGGMALSMMLTGLATGPIVDLLGVKDTLLVCAGLLVVGALISFYIFNTHTPVSTTEEDEEGEEGMVPLKALFKSKYLLMIFSVALLAQASVIVVDYQLKIYLGFIYPDEEDLANFFGSFYAWAGLIAIFLQFFVVSWLFKRFGILGVLLGLPVINLISSFMFVGSAMIGASQLVSLAAITWGCFSSGLMDDTIDIPARELLVIPLPTRMRLRAQTLLSGSLVPIGQGIGGALLVGGNYLGMDVFSYSYLAMGLCVPWFIVLWKLGPYYRDTLSKTLSSNFTNVVELQELVKRKEADDEVLKLLDSFSPSVVGFTLDLLSERELGKLQGRIRELAESSNSMIAAKAIGLLGNSKDEQDIKILEAAVKHPNRDIRKSAILSYCKLREIESVEMTMEWVHSDDLITREAAMIGACRYGGRPGLVVALPKIANAIDSSDPKERISAANLFGEIGDGENAPWLGKLLKDKNPKVRYAAIAAAQKMGSPLIVKRTTRTI